MIVTFCGHRDTFDRDGTIKAWLKETIKKLIEEGATTFYFGGYGKFDYLAASVVWEMKKTYPHITSLLVIPYLNREYNTKIYDDTFYPPIESVPMRLAIIKRNEYMVDCADVVIAYITRPFGGAYLTADYARRKKKNIIYYPV